MVVVGQYEFDPSKNFVGAGSYATVFSAKHVLTKRAVVLKQIALKDNNELTLAMLRESLIHQELKHPDILVLECVLVSDGFLYLVLEHMYSDMREHLLSNEDKYKDPNRIKKFMKSILSGLAYCHSHGILHRDIKPENLLITGDKLKIADFGSARGFITESSTTDAPSLTPALVTVEYRAPEVLLGSTSYSYAVDIWAAGCIFGEMLNPNTPLFGEEGPSDSNKVLGKIFRILGAPNDDTCPGLSELKFPDDFHVPEKDPMGLEKALPGLVDPAAKDLLLKLLCLDPEGRISAEDALRHAYFVGSV